MTFIDSFRFAFLLRNYIHLKALRSFAKTLIVLQVKRKLDWKSVSGVESMGTRLTEIEK